MKNILSLICFVFCFTNLYAQQIIESYLQVKDSVQVGKKVYLSCTHKGFTCIKADNTSAVAIIFCEDKPDTTSKSQKEFFNESYKKHLSILYISRGNPYDFFFNKKEIDDADVLLSVALKQCSLTEKPVVLIGDGRCGSRALQFVKYYKKGWSSMVLDIEAIALFDSPLDMVRYYKSAEHNLKIKSDSTNADEYKYITYLLKLNFGSRPKSYLTKYLAYSPYSFWDESNEQAIFFNKIPVKAYTEPGIEWWLESKNKNLYDTNLPDMAGFIQSIRNAGNTKSTLVVYNYRRPTEHGSEYTFALANKIELVDWLMEQIANS